MLHIEPRHLALVLSILRHYPAYRYYAYGSRAKGAAARFSDLDICVKGGMMLGEKVHLLEAFENSNLPYKVDVTLWEDCDDVFKNLIESDLVPINLG